MSVKDALLGADAVSEKITDIFRKKNGVISPLSYEETKEFYGKQSTIEFRGSANYVYNHDQIASIEYPTEVVIKEIGAIGTAAYGWGSSGMDLTTSGVTITLEVNNNPNRAFKFFMPSGVSVSHGATTTYAGTKISYDETLEFVNLLEFNGSPLNVSANLAMNFPILANKIDIYVDGSFRSGGSGSSGVNVYGTPGAKLSIIRPNKELLDYIKYSGGVMRKLTYKKRARAALRKEFITGRRAA